MRTLHVCEDISSAVLQQFIRHRPAERFRLVR
jgi:hypothetical protein